MSADADHMRQVYIERRHPLEVTADRLVEHYEKYCDRLDGIERDAISMVRFAFERISEEDAGA